MYPSARRLVAFTFHPTDPFAISVQRTNANYIVNFHVRQDPAFGTSNFYEECHFV
jgi:de-etiolated-1